MRVVFQQIAGKMPALRRQTLSGENKERKMMNVCAADPQFRAGENVVLAQGPYQGTPGVFLTLTPEDVRWAEIKRYDGVVQCHPLLWLRRSDPQAS